MKNSWTDPKVKSFPLETGKEWYVWFRFNGVLKFVKTGINKIPDYSERLEKATLLAEVLKERLEKGWNPNRNKKNSLPQPYQSDISVSEAYKKALELMLDSSLELKTKQTYKTHYAYFMQVVKKLKWEKSPFIDLDTYHFSVIIEEIVKLRKKGNCYYNKHIAICKAYCKYLKDAFIIKENKAHGIREKKYRPQEKKLLTPQQQTQIIDHFKSICPNFNIYLKTLYHLAIRPKELRLLTCSMIKKSTRGDIEVWYFDLPEEITKNDKKDIILIPEDLRNDFLGYDLTKPNWFIFGKKFEPDPKMQSINHANKLWKSEVKEKLKIDSNMYWLKSKSSNDKMRNGMSKEAVKIINRHSSEEITEIYATEHELITMEQNLDKFGSFS